MYSKKELELLKAHFEKQLALVEEVMNFCESCKLLG